VDYDLWNYNSHPLYTEFDADLPGDTPFPEPNLPAIAAHFQADPPSFYSHPNDNYTSYQASSRPMKGFHFPASFNHMSAPPTPAPSPLLFSNLLIVRDVAANASRLPVQHHSAPVSPTNLSTILMDLSSPDLEYINLPSPAYSCSLPIDYERVADGVEPIEDPAPATQPAPSSHPPTTPRLDTPRPVSDLWSTHSSPRPLFPLPAEENSRLENQENQPSAFVGPCPRQHTQHIHSYIAVSTSRRNEWRPQGYVLL
jgi:hypothetical protein